MPLLRLLMIIACVLPRAAEAQEPLAEKVQDEKQKRLQVMKRAAARYDISAGNAPAAKPLTLHPKTILRWSNPIRNTKDGAVFVWTLDGRPQAAACIYMYGPNGIDHEFQSLSETLLTAEYGGEVVWHPQEPGVQFAKVPKAPRPAGTAPLRLSQMRALARRFSAAVGKNKRRRSTRLLTQPLYRYKSDESNVLDGGLFAFVQGTDPEVLLLLEARAGDSQLQWQYALARLSSGPLQVRYRDEPLWSVERWNWQPDPQDPYITFVKEIGR